MSQVNTNQTDARASADAAVEYAVARAITDGAYRQRLVADPRGALGEFPGLTATALASLDVAFIEPRDGVTLILPPMIRTAEVSDADLEMVSGGTNDMLKDAGEIGGDMLKKTWSVFKEAVDFGYSLTANS